MYYDTYLLWNENLRIKRLVWIMNASANQMAQDNHGSKIRSRIPPQRPSRPDVCECARRDISTCKEYEPDAEKGN